MLIKDYIETYNRAKNILSKIQSISGYEVYFAKSSLQLANEHIIQALSEDASDKEIVLAKEEKHIAIAIYKAYKNTVKEILGNVLRTKEILKSQILSNHKKRQMLQDLLKLEEFLRDLHEQEYNLEYQSNLNVTERLVDSLIVSRNKIEFFGLITKTIEKRTKRLKLILSVLGVLCVLISILSVMGLVLNIF